MRMHLMWLPYPGRATGPEPGRERNASSPAHCDQRHSMTSAYASEPRSGPTRHTARAHHDVDVLPVPLCCEGVELQRLEAVEVATLADKVVTGELLQSRVLRSAVSQEQGSRHVHCARCCTFRAYRSSECPPDLLGGEPWWLQIRELAFTGNVNTPSLASFAAARDG